MNELMQFQRHPHDTIGALLSRFMSLRHRSAQQGGGRTMNWEGYSWLLLRACSVNSNQLLSLLQPCQGRFLSTEAEFQGVSLSLRRMGHILEGALSNIAARLRAPLARAYVAMDGTVGAEPGHEASAFVAQPHSDSDLWTRPGNDLGSGRSPPRHRPAIGALPRPGPRTMRRRGTTGRHRTTPPTTPRRTRIAAPTVTPDRLWATWTTTSRTFRVFRPQNWMNTCFGRTSTPRVGGAATCTNQSDAFAASLNDAPRAKAKEEQGNPKAALASHSLPT